jgi:hypothetical protein
MRPADLVHLTSLALGCALFAACADSTSPAVPRKAIAADAPAANATTSWVNKGGTNCLMVTSQDSTTFPVDFSGQTGWWFCPNQSSGFVSPDGYASLYLAKDPLNPGSSLTLETISVVRGPQVPTSYNADGSVATFTRTDSLTCDNGGSVAPIWTGITTQNFTSTTYRCCSRYFCRTCTRTTNVGGSGMLTANQPAPPPPPPPPPPAPVASVVVSPESVTVSEQQLVWLTATPLDSAGNPTDQPVSWATSDTTVATVSQQGLVTGVSVGQATITATSQGQSGAATVTVTPEPGGPYDISGAVALPRPKLKSATH